MLVLERLDRSLANRTRNQIRWLALFLVAAVGLLDFATGYELSFSLFYLIPVSVAAWYVGRSAGLWFSLLAAIAWLTADLAAGQTYSHPLIPVWNAGIRLALFSINAMLLATHRAQLTSQETLARLDAKTGVLNARAFSERLEYTFALARREAKPFTLVYIDLDDFKKVNDSGGHAEGDRVLCEIAGILKQAARKTDAVARVGGDEFALLLPSTGQEGARTLVEKIRPRLGIGCSIGAMTFARPPKNVEDAIHLADHLMYEVKRTGKNATIFGQVDPVA